MSLERRVLVIEALSDQHIALASASGKREVCCGPQHINRLKWIKRSVNLLGDSLRVEATSRVYCERIGPASTGVGIPHPLVGLRGGWCGMVPETTVI